MPYAVISLTKEAAEKEIGKNPSRYKLKQITALISSAGIVCVGRASEAESHSCQRIAHILSHTRQGMMELKPIVPKY